jgi:hypothetical protein
MIDYLDKNLAYKNQVRKAQGVNPMDKYGNILGLDGIATGGSGGGSSFWKDMYYKSKAKRNLQYALGKLKPKKIKVPKSKSTKIKLTSKKSKIPSFKTTKITLGKKILPKIGKSLI